MTVMITGVGDGVGDDDDDDNGGGDGDGRIPAFSPLGGGFESFNGQFL